MSYKFVFENDAKRQVFVTISENSEQQARDALGVQYGVLGNLISVQDTRTNKYIVENKSSDLPE